MPTPIPARIGRFEIVSQLGRGGMGVLYLARDPLLERTVAIKVLTIHNEELIERFSREARSAAALNHRNIVTVYDVGEDNGQPFIAMEYVDGETLAEMIARRPALSLGRKLQVFLDMCAGLAYAHRAGIIHRDIKPANVMIATDGTVKILDFGLARLAADSSQAALTRVGVVLGTPHYMSPEQVEGKSADERSDIFAAGLVLYELLAYRKAYQGETPHLVLHNIVTNDPPPLSTLYEGIDPELEAIVNKAIEKSPDLRYQKLASLISDLTSFKSRLNERSGESTLLVPSASDKQSDIGSRPPSSRSRTPSSAPARNIPNFDLISKRRAAQIEQYLTNAREHFLAGRFEASIEQCELAALLDPQDNRVLELLHESHRGIEERQLKGWLDEAQSQIARGALSEAELLINQSLHLRPDSPEAIRLQRALSDRRRELERARERARATRAATERGRVSLAEGAFEAAVRSADEALAFDSGNPEAAELKRLALAGIDERRRQQELEARAGDAVAAARRQASHGELESALRILQRFTPTHPLVTAAAEEIADEIQLQDRLRREAEAEEARRARERSDEEAATRLLHQVTETWPQPVEPEAEDKTKPLGIVEEARRIQNEAARVAETLAEKERAAALERERRAALNTEPRAVQPPRAGETTATPDDRTRTPQPPPNRDWLRLWPAAAGVALILAVSIVGWRWWTQDSAIDKNNGDRAAATADRLPVSVNAVPWATVRITAVDRTADIVEKTTPFVIALPEGQYRLEFANPAFRKVEQKLSVSPSGVSPLSVVMPGADVDRIVTEVLGNE